MIARLTQGSRYFAKIGSSELLEDVAGVLDVAAVQVLVLLLGHEIIVAGDV